MTATVALCWWHAAAHAGAATRRRRARHTAPQQVMHSDASNPNPSRGGWGEAGLGRQAARPRPCKGVHNEWPAVRRHAGLTDRPQRPWPFCSLSAPCHGIPTSDLALGPPQERTGRLAGAPQVGRCRLCCQACPASHGWRFGVRGGGWAVRAPAVGPARANCPSDGTSVRRGGGAHASLLGAAPWCLGPQTTWECGIPARPPPQSTPVCVASAPTSVGCYPCAQTRRRCTCRHRQPTAPCPPHCAGWLAPPTRCSLVRASMRPAMGLLACGLAAVAILAQPGGNLFATRQPDMLRMPGGQPARERTRWPLPCPCRRRAGSPPLQLHHFPGALHPCFCAAVGYRCRC